MSIRRSKRIPWKRGRLGGRQLMASEVAEEWRRIPSADGYYASSKGRVMSTLRKTARILRVKEDTRSGYHCVTVSIGGRAKSTAVHRLVCEAFHRKPKKGEVCRHLNGDPLDNRPENLTWGSQRQNMRDAQRHRHLREAVENPVENLLESCVGLECVLREHHPQAYRINGIFTYPDAGEKCSRATLIPLRG